VPKILNAAMCHGVPSSAAYVTKRTSAAMESSNPTKCVKPLTGSRSFRKKCFIVSFELIVVKM